MSLSDWQKLFVYDTSMQLMSQDLMTNYYLLGSEVGASLREMVLAKQPVQPLTNPYDEAITGTLRADAAAVDQNARNVGEAASMMGVASTAVSQIDSALSDMQDIIDAIEEDSSLASDPDIQADYNALRDQIISIVEGSDYNGIYMLDNKQWGTEQINANGQVYIQAYKNGGFDLTFQPMGDDADGIQWSSLIGANLETDFATQRDLVSDYSGKVQTIKDIYEGRQSSLEFQQTELEKQSDLLEQAAQARRQSTSSGLTPEQLLLSLLLGDSGRLLDESS